MINVRCKSCNKELKVKDNQTRCCGCLNMTTIINNTITAVDLSKVVMINSTTVNKENNFLTNDDIAWQEHRRQRKVRKLDYEIR